MVLVVESVLLEVLVSVRVVVAQTSTSLTGKKAEKKPDENLEDCGKNWGKKKKHGKMMGKKDGNGQ